MPPVDGDDVILLRNLRIMTVCGALPEEQLRPQPFEFNVEIGADLRGAGASDDLDQTINYGTLTDDIVALITGSSWVLLERMAHVVAELVLQDSLATWVTVQVDKLRPPVGHQLETSAVRVTRTAV